MRLLVDMNLSVAAPIDHRKPERKHRLALQAKDAYCPSLLSMAWARLTSAGSVCGVSW